MSIVRWRPLKDIERLFDEEFPVLSLQKIGWDLAVDVYEKEENVIAEMNLPGIDPDKIEISIENDFLRISGSRDEQKETKEKNYYSKEIKRGGFERTIELPAPVKKDKTEAIYENGVLKVILPKEVTNNDKVKIKVKK